MTEKTKTERKQIDWEAVEMLYRAGTRSLEDIGNEYGISKGRISQKAKELGWTRDLNEKIRAKAEAKLQAQAAREALNAQELNDPAKQAARRLVESEVVEATADQQFRVHMKARADVVALEEVVLTLMQELRHYTSNLEVFEELGEIMRAPDDKGQDKRNDVYLRVISFSNRVDAAKKLVEMTERLVLLKLKLYGVKLEDSEGGKGGVEDLLRNVARKMGEAA